MGSSGGLVSPKQQVGYLWDSGCLGEGMLGKMMQYLKGIDLRTQYSYPSIP